MRDLCGSYLLIISGIFWDIWKPKASTIPGAQSFVWLIGNDTPESFLQKFYGKQKFVIVSA